MINQKVYDLNKAILAKNLEQVGLLLEEFNEESINEYDGTGLTAKRRPIDCAVESGSVIILEQILVKKPKLDEPCESTGFNPIHLAVRELDGSELEETLKVLYLANADFRAKEKGTGFSLLHVALNQNKSYLVEPLTTQCRCDINATDRNFQTPLQIAIDKHGLHNDITDGIRSLGGKEYSNGTAELHERFNQQYNKYLKYAKRYPVKFRQPSNPIADDIELEQNKEEKAEVVTNSSPLIQHTMHKKPAEALNRAMINTFVKGIVSAASDKLYSVYFNNLMRKDNKEQLIDVIVNTCEDIKITRGVKDNAIYTKRINDLLEVKNNLKETMNLTEVSNTL
ncbi:hypothetical protein ACNVED_09230 [Legionella sp. D16C41]|uniref:hypothetical protein n=1 Tax=Legionella sp. D16C41 TaxID=3402688 RepID=UPI003AF7E774